jgi:hypothetical protein
MKSMKPLLSDNGAGELGIGLLLVAYGALYHVFPHRNEGAFESGVMLGLGIAATVYGYKLRKAWYKKQIDERIQKPPGKI